MALVMVERFLVTKGDASLAACATASCFETKEDNAALERSGVTVTSDVLWLCSFAWATDERRAVREEGMVPALKDAAGAELSVPVVLADRGKLMPITKKQIQ